jgi:hypothetical protein
MNALQTPGCTRFGEPHSMYGSTGESTAYKRLPTDSICEEPSERFDVYGDQSRPLTENATLPHRGAEAMNPTLGTYPTLVNTDSETTVPPGGWWCDRSEHQLFVPPPAHPPYNTPSSDSRSQGRRPEDTPSKASEVFGEAGRLGTVLLSCVAGDQLIGRYPMSVFLLSSDEGVRP